VGKITLYSNIRQLADCPLCVNSTVV